MTREDIVFVWLWMSFSGFSFKMIPEISLQGQGFSSTLSLVDPRGFDLCLEAGKGGFFGHGFDLRFSEGWEKEEGHTRF
jgi:hypothetical protein